VSPRTKAARDELSPEFAYEFCSTYTEAWNSHDPERLVALVTDDIVWHDPVRPEAAHGHEEVRAYLRSTWRAMPDLHFTPVDDQVYLSSDRRRVAAPWDARATLLGPLDPPGFAPTNSPVEMKGVDLMEFRGEQACRITTIYDAFSLARQIGAAPEPGTRNERIGVMLQRRAASSMRREAARRQGGTAVIKLHRCPVLFNKLPAHPCWRVQKTLDESGIPYEIVKEPLLRPRRTRLIEKTGQKLLPAIELEDGTWLREDSLEMVERIRGGRLLEATGAPAAPPAE
jgi:steroid delta-isomerase-like uncharacterized protein